MVPPQVTTMRPNPKQSVSTHAGYPPIWAFTVAVAARRTSGAAAESFMVSLLDTDVED